MVWTISLGSLLKCLSRTTCTCQHINRSKEGSVEGRICCRLMVVNKRTNLSNSWKIGTHTVHNFAVTANQLHAIALKYTVNGLTMEGWRAEDCDEVRSHCFVLRFLLCLNQQLRTSRLTWVVLFHHRRDGLATIEIYLEACENWHRND